MFHPSDLPIPLCRFKRPDSVIIAACHLKKLRSTLKISNEQFRTLVLRQNKVLNFMIHYDVTYLDFLFRLHRFLWCSIPYPDQQSTTDHELIPHHRLCEKTCPDHNSHQQQKMLHGYYTYWSGMLVFSELSLDYYCLQWWCLFTWRGCLWRYNLGIDWLTLGPAL